VNQPLLLQVLENTTGHLPRTSDDASDLLARDAYLHAVRMGHGVRLLAQLQQGTCHPSGYVEEGKVAHFAAGVKQTLCELGAHGVQDLFGVGLQVGLEQLFQA